MKNYTTIIIVMLCFGLKHFYCQVVVNDSTLATKEHIVFRTYLFEKNLDEERTLEKDILINIYDAQNFNYSNDSLNVLVQQISVNKGPGIVIYIPREKIYIIEFSCKGNYIKKRLLFNTEHIPINKNPKVTIAGITLFKKDKNIDYSIFQIPFVKTWYNKDSEVFEYDEDYINAILTAYDMFNDLSKKYLKIQKDEKNRVDQLFNNEKLKWKNTIIVVAGISISLILFIVILFFIRINNNRKKTNQSLEAKNFLIESQKHLVEEKQREILDSINYAKRIQYTLLAHADFLNENIPNHFVYFNPKDIVSGDFYWATSTGSGTNQKFYLAVCDSTGHGVPGAFMSLLNISFLNEAVNEKGIEEPNKVFDFVRQRLIDNISKEGQKDGFDGILICIDKSTNKITYAAANNVPILIQNNQLTELNADRIPVGVGERKENFTLHTLEVSKGDVLYLYTDGYADQFGGPKGKKFKYKQLNDLLLALHTKPLREQHTELKSAFEKWKGNLEQVDDVCVIGIRI